MDLNSLLIWLVCLSCLVTIVRMGRHHPPLWGWVVVSGLTLLVTGGLAVVTPAIAAKVGACLWGLLLLLPTLISYQVHTLAAQQRFQQACQLAIVLSWLHPADGFREYPHQLRALALAQQGDMTAAHTMLHRYESAKIPVGRNFILILYLMQADWPGLLAWLTQTLPESLLSNDSTLLVYYLRALGETGDLNQLLLEIDRFDAVLRSGAGSQVQNLVYLFVFGFCGQRQPVEQLFSSSLSAYAPTTRQFWLATADLAAGNQDAGREQLLSLRDHTTDLTIRNTIDWRLAQPLRHPDTLLDDRAQQILARLVAEASQDMRYNFRARPGRSRPYITYTLIGLNLAMFILAVLKGGSEDVYTLYELGALVPQEVFRGNWWRLLAATFLHLGWLHLLMNMLGLYIFGPFVEFALGTWRYLLTYLGAGMGSMFIASAATVLRLSNHQFVVGASGSILGLVGAMAAILVYGWRKELSRIAARQLLWIGLIIGLQVVYDLTTPRISFIGHLAGLIIGFILASFLKPQWQIKKFEK